MMQSLVCWVNSAGIKAQINFLAGIFRESEKNQVKCLVGQLGFGSDSQKKSCACFHEKEEVEDNLGPGESDLAT